MVTKLFLIWLVTLTKTVQSEYTWIAPQYFYRKDKDL